MVADVTETRYVIPSLEFNTWTKKYFLFASILLTTVLGYRIFAKLQYIDACPIHID